MKSKTYIVTGGNAGLGLDCTANLGEDPGAVVVVASRDAARASVAVQPLKARGMDVRVMRLDLASLASVRAFAAAFISAELPPLVGLVCNAGLQEVQTPSTTQEGFETTFGVNHLGHFLLVQELLPALAHGARIVFVSSGTHDPAEKTGIPPPVYTTAAELARDMEPGARAGQRRYSTSKLCNVYTTYELARRLEMSPEPRLRSLRVNAIDPGLMPGTGLARQQPASLRFVWNYLMPALRLFVRNVHTTTTSGRRLADLAMSAQTTGKYYSDGRERRSSDLSYDENKSLELWNSSGAMVGLQGGL